MSKKSVALLLPVFMVIMAGALFSEELPESVSEQIKIDVQYKISPSPGTVNDLSMIQVADSSGFLDRFPVHPVLYKLLNDGSLGDKVTDFSVDSISGNYSITFRADSIPSVAGVYALKIPSRTILSDFISDSIHYRRINYRSSDDNVSANRYRVLDIGNSYTSNSTQYLRALIADLGIDVEEVCLYNAIFSGGSFKNWYDVYNDNDSTEYWINRSFGKTSLNNLDNYGSYKGGGAFRALLQDNEWDLIVIHQASRFAPYYELWNTDDSGGYLSEFVGLIRDNQPDTPLATHLVHSYGNDPRFNSEGLTTRERWKYISASVKQMTEDYDISLLIPYGTAIENLRAIDLEEGIYLNNEYDLLSDGTHLSPGLARYTAACCYYEAVFAPIFGKSMMGNGLRIIVPEDSEVNSERHGISLTDDNAYIAQQMAKKACDNPLMIQDPVIMKLGDQTDYYLFIPRQKYINVIIKKEGDAALSIKSVAGVEIPVGLNMDENWSISEVNLYSQRPDDSLNNYRAGEEAVVSLEFTPTGFIIPGEYLEEDKTVEVKTKFVGEIDAIDDESGIVELYDSGIKINVENGTICIQGLVGDEEIRVFSIGGLLIKTLSAHTSGLRVDLPKGVYILSARDKFVKINTDNIRQ